MKKIKSFFHKIKFKNKNSFLYVLGLLLVILLTTAPYLFYNLAYKGKIFPNIFVGGNNIGGLDEPAAQSFLSGSVEVPEKITLKYNEKSFDINPRDFEVVYDFNSSVNRAYDLPRTGNFFYDAIARLKLLKTQRHLGLSFTLNEADLDNVLEKISNTVSVNPIYPSIKMTKDNIEVNKGTPGTDIDSQKLRELIGYNLAQANSADISIPITIIDPTLNDLQTEIAKKRAEAFRGKTLTIKFEYSEYNYKDSDLVKFINPAGGLYDNEIVNAVYKIAGDIDRDPQNPKFQFDGNRVTEFSPASDGVVVQSDKLKEILTSNLNAIEQNPDNNVSFEVPVVRTKPQVTTQEVNDMGIKELIGRGTSTYYHSIPSRVYNVNLAASRINGTLVAPGETFSFNQTLGDVSKLTGYKEAYIISEGKTILGDGGGVCQVSTTLFRAVLNAGLPINDRTAHAYRVGYYEQNSPPGIDATVYSPRPDFKFTNNTGGHILVVAKNNPKNYSLVFELYGTSDGRVASISRPVVSNVSPALPTIYQDDPTLPSGTIKQVDYAAAGAKVTFNYTVQKDGEQIYKRTFTSNYQPWAAVYLRGIGPSN